MTHYRIQSRIRRNRIGALVFLTIAVALIAAEKLL